jgi:hypothetical protein
MPRRAITLISTTCSWVNIGGKSRHPHPRWVTFTPTRWVSITAAVTHMEANDVKRLKALELENAWLKKLLA